MKILKSFFFGIFFLSLLGIYAFAQNQFWETRVKIMNEDIRHAGLIFDGEKIRTATIGFQNFIGDMFWIKTVQYLGANVFYGQEHLFALVDLITDISPDFWAPYRVGILLGPDEGLMDETEILIEKAKKNISEESPNRWRVFWNSAYFYYYYKEDYEKAIEYLEKCTNLPGCLPSAKTLSRSLQNRTGKYGLAIEKWIEIFADEKSTDKELEVAKGKLEESIDLYILTEAAQNFQKIKDLSDISHLKDFSFIPSEEMKRKLIALRNISHLTGINIPLKDGKVIITEETITSPAEANPYIWNSEEKKIRTKWF